MAKKKFRKSIRINGKTISERFTSKEAAENWYSHLRTHKAQDKVGLILPQNGGVLVKDFALVFMAARRKEHPESTWGADEQRLSKYVLPKIGNIQIGKVDAIKVRSLLLEVTGTHGLGEKTRDRVRALVSAFFNAALNHSPPLVSSNPTFGLEFSGRRKGSRPPSFLQTTRDCVKYISAAKKLSHLHLAIAALGLGAGLRKQEMIPLKWSALDQDAHGLDITEKYIQASGEIVRGTKAGDDSTRFVPISDYTEALLLDVRGKSPFSEPDDFVLCDRAGEHLSPKVVYALNMETCEAAGVVVTVHGLRHSFGREFAAKSKNIHALKDILGHTNLQTTQIYSTLGKERLQEFRDTVSYGGCDD